MTHEDGMYRCLVAHLDKDGNCLPPCIKCSKCGEWIRPEDMDSDCPEDKPEDKRNVL